VAADYQTLRLSLKAHPMAMLRPVFEARKIKTCEQTSAARDGAWVRTAGIVLVRQRPGNGKAIFITLEDETGVTNVLLWARVFQSYRAQVMGARLMLVEGRVQKSVEGIVHLMGVRVHDRSAELERLSNDHRTEIELTRADEVKHPQHPRGHRASHRMFHHPRDVRVVPKSRDFH
jgi:error-prone DNA polymerase